MTGLITELDAAAYHTDTVASTPSLSASIAHTLVASSPAHARAAHPKLNPDYQRVDEQKYDVGTAAHAILLEGADAVAIIDADSWRTSAAKEQRDAARAVGKVPLLAAAAADVELMVEAVREQLAAHTAHPPLFTGGKPEQTLVWEERDGTVCRSRVDWLHDDHSAVDDLKTTSRSANPEAFSRNLFGYGCDVQAAFYIRGVEAITGVTPEFRWVVVETATPFALSVVAPGPDVLTIGRKKVVWALARWRECLDSGVWPAYPSEVCWAELPAWEESRWLERELREVA